MMSFVWSYFVLLALSLCWLAYKVTNPQECEFEEGSRLYQTQCYEPLLSPNDLIDLKVYVGTASHPPSKPLWRSLNVPLNQSIEASIAVPIPPTVRVNGTEFKCWISIEKSPEIDEIDGAEDGRLAGITHVILHTALTSMKIPRSFSKRKNLLDSSDGTNGEYENENRIWPHWKYGAHPLSMRLVHLNGVILGSPFLDVLGYRLYTRMVQAKGSRGMSNLQSKYEPIVFVDETSLLRNHLVQISRNVSRPPATLHFKYEPTTPILFSFKVFMKQVLNMVAQTDILGEAEIDEIKYWISDERIYRFFLTQIIGFVHLLLEYLAFRGDWRFFVGRHSFAGLSISSLIFSVARSLVIFLYLLDADTSTIILFGLGKDVVWSFWKLYRVTSSRAPTQSGDSSAVETASRGRPSVSEVTDLANRRSQSKGKKLSPSELQRLTTWCDNYATTHVGLCVYPLVAGTAVYSMVYNQHKGWWSWFISSLADSVYLFGFISMTPQLYINYKLKSVAHLPLSAFMFKMFNTFIDDIFAFMIKMPWKHRIMTFRDDLIFLAFLYQWWIYRVDKSRPNEFGFLYDEGVGEVEEDESQAERKNGKLKAS